LCPPLYAGSIALSYPKAVAPGRARLAPKPSQLYAMWIYS
jgi:hypothetical protein